MTKCKFCHNTATRNHCNHRTGNLEDLCEVHYFPWHPIMIYEKKYKKQKKKLEKKEVKIWKG